MKASDEFVGVRPITDEKPFWSLPQLREQPISGGRGPHSQAGDETLESRRPHGAGPFSPWVQSASDVHGLSLPNKSVFLPKLSI